MTHGVKCRAEISPPSSQAGRPAAPRHAAPLRLNGTERGNHLIIPIIIVCECISMADKAVAISISTVSLYRSRYTPTSSGPWSSAHTRVANLQNSVKNIQRFAENKQLNNQSTLSNEFLLFVVSKSLSFQDKNTTCTLLSPFIKNDNVYPMLLVATPQDNVYCNVSLFTGYALMRNPRGPWLSCNCTCKPHVRLKLLSI